MSTTLLCATHDRKSLLKKGETRCLSTVDPVGIFSNATFHVWLQVMEGGGEERESEREREIPVSIGKPYIQSYLLIKH